MSEKIFKVSGKNSGNSTRKLMKAEEHHFADKMPAEFFARTAISDEVAVLLFGI